MVITYYGLACFKIQAGEEVLAIDPFKGGPRFEAHAAIFTNRGLASEHSITGSPLIFSTPGEYETREIVLTGIPVPEGTPFFIEWESISLLHLDGIEKKESLDRVLEIADTVDILMISSSRPGEAHKIATQIDPRIIIPMQGSDTKKSSLESFIKEFGEKAEKLDKLTVKKKGLPAEGHRLVVLTSPR